MPYQLANIDNEYLKDPALKRIDVQMFLEWIQKQSHLPKITELQAIQFLQSCYYRIETAKMALDNYFTIRTLCPDIFTVSLNDPLFKLTMDTTLITTLPKRPSNNYNVIYTRLINTNPDNYIYNYQIKLFDLFTILDLNLNGTNPGYYIIVDMSGGTFGHLTKINITTAKKYSYYLQEALPIRLKGVHLINVVPFIDKMLAIFRPFMKKELQDMIYVHNTENFETLYEYVPKECLPLELGGTAPSLQQLQNQTNQWIIDNFDFINDHQQLRVDEAKRSNTSKNINQMFGVDGTFKKLEVD